MKLKMFIMIMMVTCVAQAKGPQAYEKGTLVKMDSMECGVDTRGAEGIGGVLGVDDSHHTKAQQLLCQQYLLRGDKVDFAIRPKDPKHPAILPVGQAAEFRIQKDRMLVRVPQLDQKERQFVVVAMSQRAEQDGPDKVVTTASK